MNYKRNQLIYSAELDQVVLILSPTSNRWGNDWFVCITSSAGCLSVKRNLKDFLVAKNVKFKSVNKLMKLVRQ